MPKIRTYCVAAGCSNNSKNSDGSFFMLPSGQSENEKKRCQKWIELLGREDLLEKPDLKKSSYRVCSAHFDTSSIITTTARSLKPNAVPTLKLANQPHEESSCSTASPVEEKSTLTSLLLREETSRKRKHSDEVNVLASILTKETPTKRKFSDELKKCKKIERKLNHEVRKLKQELEAKNNPIMCDPVDEIIRRFQRLIDWQNKLKNKYRGAQYEAEYKLFALNLHYSSPHAYRCLQTVLKLPDISTLKKFKILIPPTLDSRVLDSLALKIKSLPESAKYCTICVDEVTLKRNLFYNITNDKVIGFHNVNGRTSSEIAGYAFVIMLQGIYVNWQQPIAYALFATAQHVDIWLNEVIFNLSTIGIKVKAIVTDQGSNFDKFAKDVKNITMEKPYFVYDNTKIYYILDVPQLVKCIRNDLLTSDFILDGKKISWEHIVQLYNDQKNRNLRLIPKLTEAHIHPDTVQKMKVKLALQVLSRSVGAALHTYIDLGEFSDEARPTADFVELMNNLFDVLNASRMKCDNKFQTAFRLSKDQEKVLKDAKEMFTVLKAIDRKTGNNNTGHIETFVNFQISIQTMTMLFEDLRKDGFEYLLTRRCKKDNLKKNIGEVRKPDGSCSEPTPIQLQRAFSKLFVCNMMKNTPDTNCLMDICQILLQVEDILKMKLACSDSPQSECRNAISLAAETDYRIEFPAKNALTYVSGYLFFKCASKHSCPAIDTISSSEPSLHDTFFFNKYSTYNQGASFYGNLKMPPKEFIEYIKKLESVFTQNFEKVIHSNPGSKLYKLFQSVSPPTSCSCFPVEYLIKLFTRFRIFAAIKLNNRQFKNDDKSISKYLKVCHL